MKSYLKCDANANFSLIPSKLSQLSKGFPNSHTKIESCFFSSSLDSLCSSALRLMIKYAQASNLGVHTASSSLRRRRRRRPRRRFPSQPAGHGHSQFTFPEILAGTDSIRCRRSRILSKLIKKVSFVFELPPSPSLRSLAKATDSGISVCIHHRGKRILKLMLQPGLGTDDRNGATHICRPPSHPREEVSGSGEALSLRRFVSFRVCAHFEIGSIVGFFLSSCRGANRTDRRPRKLATGSRFFHFCDVTCRPTTTTRPRNRSADDGSERRRTDRGRTRCGHGGCTLWKVL